MSESTAPKKTTFSVLIGLVVAAAAWWFGTGKEGNETASQDPPQASAPEQPAPPANPSRTQPKPTPRQPETEPPARTEPEPTTPAPSGSNNLSRRSTEIVARAFRNKQSDVQLDGEARVKVMLRDDNEGSRHQKWICEFENGQTVLFSHNIDLAPRVPLRKGDVIQFRGEYEWTEQGGVIHWTHHDPGGRHVDGFIRLGGETYQ